MSLSPEDILVLNRTAACAAIEAMGGISEAARKLSTPEREMKAGHIWAWLNRDKRGIPLEYLEQVELLSDIPREELRRDIPWRKIDEHIR